jgi:outer membrane receptor protein involved in Fe transport
MKMLLKPSLRRGAVMAAALVTLFGTGWAQTIKPAAPTPEEDNVVTLSPFNVDASRDVGYQATSTLAGSRINTQLKDVAAPISVLTKEFLDDLKAVDVNHVMNYVVGGEGTGTFTSSLPNVTGYPDDQIVQNPTGATRLRGLSAPDYTRDFFYTIGNQIGFDTFNLEQVTVSRGPNSILAGLGSAAGLINYSPQQADLRKNSNEVSYQFGSWGSQRATLNSNLTTWGNKLAVRVAGAYTEKGFKQKPSFSHDRRGYVAAAVRPWSKTTVRASYEEDQVDRNLPNTLTPIDSVSQWVARGSPTASPPAVPTFRFPVWTEQGTGPTVVINKNHVVEASYPVTQPHAYTYLQQNLSNVGLWVPLAMNNNRYIRLQDTNMNAQLAHLNYKAFNASLDQAILPGLAANVSYTKEDFGGNKIVLNRPQYTVVFVDVNQTLPTGAPNPHFGELYVDQRGLDNKRVESSSNEAVRATLTYDLNLTRRNKWLGRWRLTGFVEDRKTETEGTGYTTNAFDSATRAALGQVQIRQYLGGSATTVATSSALYLGLLSGVADNYASGSSYDRRTIFTSYVQAANNRALTKLGTSAVVGQAYLWDDRIVGLFGIRRDKNKAANLSRSGTPLGNTPYGPMAEVSAQTKSYGVVFHATKWMSFSLNRSENFIPNAGSIDLLGNTTPVPTGNSKDYGVSFRLLDDRLTIRFNHFKTEAKGGSPGSQAQNTAQWWFPWFDRVQIAAIARENNIPYQIGILPGLLEGDPRLFNGYTADNVSKGYEVDATFNVTKNWRIMGSLSSNEAKLSGIATNLTALIEQRLAYYKQQGLWNGPVGGAIWGAAGTGEYQWNTWVLTDYIGYKSSEGKPSQQLAKYHASAMTNYTFSQNWLKGWSVGGGLRYVDKAIIGNPAIRNASGAVTGLDVANPYTASAYVAADAWVGYNLKPFRDKKYVLSFSVNVYDLQEDGHFRPIKANSDGAHASYRIVQPRSFYFTTKLQF